ncbi:MAG TPA: BON domain-containing protein [Caulobacteraceae bacterium]|jgi:osmotically-inducible protein OsmY|nr:BON domain-containing protein [Caulobacteraceae bacterium]
MPTQHRWNQDRGREWRGEDDARREGRAGRPRDREDYDYRDREERSFAAGRAYGPPREDYRYSDEERRRIEARYHEDENAYRRAYSYVPNPREGRGLEPRSFRDRAGDEIASWFGDYGAERRREWDRQLARHRGRGPKGYKRSDERIREDVNDRLTDDPYLDASEIEVLVAIGEVTLTGTVESREDKRRTEDLADAVSGVRHVQNNLRIARSGARDAGEIVRSAAGEPISGTIAGIADGDT